jgi:hypothetical protein
MEYREFLTNLMTYKKLMEDISELHDISETEVVYIYGSEDGIKCEVTVKKD